MSQQKEAPLTGEVEGREGNNDRDERILAYVHSASSVGNVFPTIEGKLFHVYTVTPKEIEVLVGNEDGTVDTATVLDFPRTIQTGKPLTWDRACQWARGIKTMIAEGRGGSFVDCGILPVDPPVTSPVAVYDREIEQLKAANRELKRQLTQCRYYREDAAPIFTSTAQVEATVGRMFAPRQEIDCIIDNVATLAAQVSAERLERDTHLACAVRQVLSMREVVAGPGA